MEEVKVTEEQAKKLKLFTYYAKGYGHDEVNKSIYTQDCMEDYNDDMWYGSRPGSFNSFESYDSIDSVINEIMEENDLYSESVSDCDNRGTLTVNIDCIERTLKIDASEVRYAVNSTYDEVILSELDEESEGFGIIFNYMNSKNYSEGVVEFSGSGDDGQIDKTIIYDSTDSQEVPKDIMSFFYEWLSRHGGGWEINEGSQGKFIFLPKENMVRLYFEENFEDNFGLGQVFYTKF